MIVPDDVLRWIVVAFKDYEQKMALEYLSIAVDHEGNPPGERLIRAAAVASKGDIAKLLYYINLLRIDWRDVIVAGEYDVINNKLVHVRDLTKPILDASRKMRPD